MRFKRKYLCFFYQHQLPEIHHTVCDKYFSFMEEAKSNLRKMRCFHTSVWKRLQQETLVIPRPLPPDHQKHESRLGALLLLKSFIKKFS